MRLKTPKSSDDLQTIPGVGPRIAEDLRELGVRRVSDLRGRDPERLYRRINALKGERQDPCLLYVFRCAVYFARTPRPDPVLLKWWTWKDRELPGREPAHEVARSRVRRARR